MCLCVLTSHPFRLHLLGEYIITSTEQNRILSDEVYDLVFSTTVEYAELDLICVSPHNLIREDGQLCVRIIAEPEQGTNRSVFYERSLGFGARVEDGYVHLSLAGMSPDNNVKKHKCEVVSGKLGLPLAVMNDPGCIEFMKNWGTCFLLQLRDVKPNRKYICRICVSPVALLEMPNPFQSVIADAAKGRIWNQELRIVDPNTCMNKYRAMLQHVQNHQDQELNVGSAKILATIVNSRFVVPVDLHRVILQLPNDSEMASCNTYGDCVPLGMRYLLEPDPNTRVFYEWIGGSDVVGPCDFQFAAERIHEWLLNWCKDSPKKKEEISTATGLTHENCTAVTDQLEKYGLITKEHPSSLYSVANEDPTQNQLAFSKMLNDSATWLSFDCRGFDIRFGLRFRESYRRHPLRIDVPLSISLFTLVISITALIISLLR